MKVFRFMSESEFNKFVNGEVLENNIDHSITSKTNSKGFCFLDLKEYEPEDAIHFLTGLVSLDYCVKFKTNKELIKTHGVYADNSKDKEKFEKGIYILDILELLCDLLDGGQNIDTMEINEYCTEKYSNKDFELIGYVKNPKVSFTGEKWNWNK